MATTRTATTNWQGSLMEGSGNVSLDSSGVGTFDVSWPSRAEQPNGRTSPEELIAAAHSACFSMALSHALAGAGNPPESVETQADVSFQPGEGITGTAAAERRPIAIPAQAHLDPRFKAFPNLPEDEYESILAVPLRHGDRTTGTIVLSKLGIDQFDRDDMRLLEVLASNAAVALENARLLSREREAAETSGALLYLSDVLSRARDSQEVLAEALSAIPLLMGCPQVQAWVRDPQTGSFRTAQQRGFDLQLAGRMARLEVPAEVADSLLLSKTEPFVLSSEAVARVPDEYRMSGPQDNRPLLVAPLRWEPEGFAAICVWGPDPEGWFSNRQLRLARGIADITALALGNARRYEEMEASYTATIETLSGALEAREIAEPSLVPDAFPARG
jgi:lipoyl-dependent peroxiredoxin